jgi:hypothetical protein
MYNSEIILNECELISGLLKNWVVSSRKFELLINLIKQDIAGFEYLFLISTMEGDNIIYHFVFIYLIGQWTLTFLFRLIQTKRARK